MSTYDRQATDRKALFFRTTRCNKPFERPANIPSQTLQLITSAHRLHIFGIRRFDNTKYFKIDKGISLGKYFIEIDHLPIQPFHCCTPSFPPPPHEQFCVLCFASPLKQILTPFYVSKSRNIKNLAPLLVLCSLRKGFDKK